MSPEACYFIQKTKMFKTLIPQIFLMKVSKLIKTIFYIAQRISLRNQVKFKTGRHAHFYKLCLVKWAILFKKQHFGVFENPNIRE